MQEFECVKKVKDKNNRIVKYSLININGKVVEMQPDLLKSALLNNKIKVVNLTLTKDNRLIGNNRRLNKAANLTYNLTSNLSLNSTTRPTKSGKVYTLKEIKEIMGKANLMGKTEKLRAYRGDNLLIYKVSKDENIVYIPDSTAILSIEATEALGKLEGHIIVVGGRGLETAANMFKHSDAKSFDFSLFESRNVASFYHTFSYCNAPILDLRGLSTESAGDMGSMFYGCKSKKIIFGDKFDTSKVVQMSNMFGGCMAEELDLRFFDTSNATIMSDMFNRCKARIINVSSFDTSRVKLMNQMFKRVNLKVLDLRNFDTSNVTLFNYMFADSVIGKLYIEFFDTSKADDTKGMFARFVGQRIFV